MLGSIGYLSSSRCPLGSVHIIVGHHCYNDQGVIVGMMYATSITIAEGDVIIVPLKVLYRLFVQVIDISERPLRFLGVVVSGPTCFSSEMWST